nr:MAG TPA: hypothetical protein [Caudoviricetes sp.]
MNLLLLWFLFAHLLVGHNNFLLLFSSITTLLT